MRPDIQVAVIGGGPAGARTAELLARRGLAVTLLEAGGPTVENLCSGLLNREGQAALGLARAGRAVKALPEGAVVAELPASVQSQPYTPALEVIDADHRTHCRYDPGYVNMDRPLFDQWLRERAARAGAKLEFETRVQRISESAGAVHLATSKGELSAAICIDATGWKALSRKLLAAQSPAAPPARLPHVYAFQGTVEADIPEGSMWAVFDSQATSYYGWLVPKGNGRFLLGAGFWPGAAEGRVARAGWSKLDFVARLIERSNAKLKPCDGHSEGCPISTMSSASQLWWGRGRVFAVGEAAGLVSPSSGDGIHFALEHAAAVAAELGDGLGGQIEDARLRRMVDMQIRDRLGGALSELRFNCLKARVAANSMLRGLAMPFLPVLLRRPVERLPYHFPAPAQL